MGIEWETQVIPAYSWIQIKCFVNTISVNMSWSSCEDVWKRRTSEPVCLQRGLGAPMYMDSDCCSISQSFLSQNTRHIVVYVIVIYVCIKDQNISILEPVLTYWYQIDLKLISCLKLPQKFRSNMNKMKFMWILGHVMFEAKKNWWIVRDVPLNTQFIILKPYSSTPVHLRCQYLRHLRD